MNNYILPFRKKTRLRTKMLLATLIIVTIFMGLSILYFGKAQKKIADTLVTDFSAYLLAKTYNGFIYPMALGDTESVKRELETTGDQMPGLKIFITDLKKQVKFDSEKEDVAKGINDHLTNDGAKAALDNSLKNTETASTSGLVFHEKLNGKPFMTTIKPIMNGDDCTHCHGKSRKILGAMVIQQPMNKVHNAVFMNMLKMSGASAIALIILVILINMLFRKIVTERLGELQEKTAQVAEGNVNVEVSDVSIDSIGKLTRNFNTMITSIRDRIEYANSLQLGVSDPFFMTDPERKITFVNDAALKLVGLTSQEVLERPCQEVFLAPTYRHECPVKMALNTEDPIVGKRVGMNGAKGMEVPVICSAALLKDSSGKILGAFEIMRDLTVEIEAENRIKEAYSREEKAKKGLEVKVIELSEVLGKVSQGDLTPRGTPSGKNDSMDVLTHRINETLEGMTALIKQVKDAILPVINGVLRISRENQSLAQRTEQQAAAMEEISATLEELVSNTGENLANTRHADGLSKDAVKVAHEGGGEVDRTANAMAEIESASAKVVEMMDLINEITFQTNLLSINAAVEAARAGEQGRGFAVVANEVRNLAKRSAIASKDIQVLVREIMEKVTTGRQWVGELQGCFNKIVGTSGQVSDALGEVSMGSEESSRGIEQINQGTQEVCEVNEKNASFVDELAQETQKLKEKARNLQELTAVFVLGTEDIMQRQMELPEDDFIGPDDLPPPPSRSTYGSGERRRAAPTSRALRDDLVTRPAMEEMNDDLLEQEFEEGFEEF